jgi:hypothetical protein
MIVTGYTFSSGGYTFTVQYDDASYAITCISDSPALVDEVPVEDITPPGPDGVATSFCVGTTLYQLLATTTYPFGYFNLIEDSPTCGYAPIDCSGLSVSATPVAESDFEADNGSVNLVAGGGVPPYVYSLDDVTYQLSGSFSGLTPGSYTGHVRASNGCTASIGFDIDAALQVAPPPIPWEDGICHFFTLNGFPIQEPIKWDAVSITGERDRTYHGWNYQFTDEEIDLEFDCDSGKSIIETEYDLNGIDGEVLFEYGVTYNGADHILFQGKLNLKGYNHLTDRIACPVERYDGNLLLENRNDVKVSMGATTTIDGSAVTPPAPILTTLHGKQLRKRYFAGSAISPYQSNTGNTLNAYTTLDGEAPVAQEIETIFNYPVFTSSGDPVAESKYLIDVKFSGTYTIRVNASALVTYNRVFLSWPTSGTMQFVLRVDDVETPLGSPATQNFLASPGGLTTLTVDQTLTRTLAAGQKVYIYIKHTFTSAAPWGVTVSQTYNDTEILSLEAAQDSQANGWLLFDAINQVIKCITDNGSKLKSSFFGVQPTVGAGAYNLLTNGFNIRQYEPTDRPLKIALKESLESLNAIWCIGVQYDTNKVRIERADYFYQDRQILFIPEVYELNREPAEEYLPNEVEVGYETYQTDGYNTLDEFNTKQTYSTPIKNNKRKLPLLSKFIASGYSLETSRRQQFSTSATDSFQNDDNCFIISVRKTTAGELIPEKNEAFASVTDMIGPTTAYNLRLSPKRMLYNWAVWLKNAFYFKAGTEKLRNTLFVQNGGLTTQLSPSDDRNVGDLNRVALQEKADVTLNDYPVERGLFIPEWIRFKCKINPNDALVVNLALKGAYDPTKNYGYIIYRDPVLGYGRGWPFSLKYNFYTEEAEFLLLRKL